VERNAIFTPLGIRFWDPVRDRQVSDGLVVTARPYRSDRSGGNATPAVRTGSGDYAFHGLPGLHAVEYPANIPATPAGTIVVASPPVAQPFIIEVTDRQQRFLSVAFIVQLPLPYTGLFTLTPPGSPPGASLPGFYLFSSPNCSAAPGLATLRARLVEYGSSPEVVAAYAVVVVQVNGSRWFGIADSSGCVAIQFPYPALVGSFNGSPPGSAPPLAQQSWQVNIGVRYTPTASASLPGTTLPDLRALLNQQPAMLFSSAAAALLPQVSYSLTYGQDLVVRTGDVPELWVAVAASP
jgi:hypothetical protein